MSIKDRIRIAREETLVDGFARYTRTHLNWRAEDGTWIAQERECLHRKGGTAFLPFDPERRTVMLVRQFRWPAYQMGHDRLMLEAPGGYLDGAAPEARVREEAMEELGLRVQGVRVIHDLMMLPGSVASRQVFLVATYGEGDRIAQGGGLPEEGEEVLPVEMTLDAALEAARSGEIVCAKTVLLLYHVALEGGARP